jgi:hypothetical protein
LVEFNSSDLEWDDRFPETSLHPLMQAHIDTWQTDSKGKLVSRSPTVEAHSLLRNFPALVATAFRFAGTEAVRCYSGSYVYPPYTTGETYSYYLSGYYGSAYVPITVGRGVASPTLGDYWPQDYIANGTGPGLLQYGFISPLVMETTVNTRRMMISRAFTNASGALITVQEICLIGSLYYLGQQLVIIDRSLLPCPIAAGNTQTFKYTLSATVV